MRIGIIGAGNMGGAIARGLAGSKQIGAENVTVSNPSKPKLVSLQEYDYRIHVTLSNAEAARSADMIILAVKPWQVETVLKEIPFDPEHQILVSVAASLRFEDYVRILGKSRLRLFRVIPNTAISEKESVNLIASYGKSEEDKSIVKSVFEELGLSLMIEEQQMEAGMALTSCGIAYVFKYVQAAMQAGIEMGLRPVEAQQMVAQCLKGAAEILLRHPTHPAVEIDKVTTPGGLTIKGINELDHAGFTSAVIRAIKVSRD